MNYLQNNRLGINNTLINNIFSSISNKYDLMNDLMSMGLHKGWKKKLVAEVMREVEFKILCITDKLNSVNSSYKKEEGENLIKLSLLDVATGTSDIPLLLVESLRKIDQLKLSGALNSASQSSYCLNRVPQKLNLTDHFKLMDHFKIIASDVNDEMLSLGRAKLIDANILNVETIKCDATDLIWSNNSFDFYTIAFGIRNVIERSTALKEAYRVLKNQSKFFCLEFGQPGPFVNKLYGIHSKYVIPLIGRYVAKNEKAYEYLVDSIRDFPAPVDFVNMIKKAGFTDVSYLRLADGIVNLYVATKE